jgi:hypothetical protein
MAIKNLVSLSETLARPRRLLGNFCIVFKNIRYDYFCAFQVHSIYLVYVIQVLFRIFVWCNKTTSRTSIEFDITNPFIECRIASKKPSPYVYFITKLGLDV